MGLPPTFKGEGRNYVPPSFLCLSQESIPEDFANRNDGRNMRLVFQHSGMDPRNETSLRLSRPRMTECYARHVPPTNFTPTNQTNCPNSAFDLDFVSL